MKPLVSIIVPVYNVKKYFEKCVNSIRCQTVKDIEVILVDDGSTDGCPALCDRFTEEDTRIRVIHQKNAGVSAARNAGIELAAADWIMFSDADDYLEPDAVNSLYKQTRVRDCDVVIGSYWRTYMDQEVCAAISHTGEVQWYNSDYRFYLQAGCFTAASRNPEMFPPEMKNLSSLTTPCARLYRRSFIVKNNLKFRVGMPLREDAFFNLGVFTAASMVAFVNSPVYHYRMRQDSASISKNDDHHKRIIASFDCLNQFVMEHNQKLYPYLQVLIVVDILRLTERYGQDTGNSEDLEKYTGLLETVMQHTEIYRAVQIVTADKISNLRYRPALKMIRNGQYREAILYHAESTEKKEVTTRKIKFPN